jgi:hypothetical protein
MVNARRALGVKVTHRKSLHPLTERDAAEKFSAAVIDFSAGQLASAARRSKDTAKRWKSARACPNGASLINMARSLPTIRTWLLSQIDAEMAIQFDAGHLYSALKNLADVEGQEGDAARGILREMARLAKEGGE